MVTRFAVGEARVHHGEVITLFALEMCGAKDS